jgi:purine-nucleoside phosphorylase
LNPRFAVGDIMLIRGLSRTMLGNRVPLLQADEAEVGGYIDPGEESSIERLKEAARIDARGIRQFDHAALAAVHARALERGVALREGTYAAVLGPSYETRAEIRMLRMMGADAVGMSTVPEYTAAARLGLDVVGLSLITNTLSDTARQELDHADVVTAGARAARSMRLAIEAALER